MPARNPAEEKLPISGIVTLGALAAAIDEAQTAIEMP
jgi:hypothetical protein